MISLIKLKVSNIHENINENNTTLFSSKIYSNSGYFSKKTLHKNNGYNLINIYYDNKIAAIAFQSNKKG